MLDLGQTNAPIVVFRADASLQIGAGHVMRCLTLARGLRAQGAICHFICRALEGHLIEAITVAGFETHTLAFAPSGTDRDDIGSGDVSSEHDARETRRIVYRLKPDWLVVDSYSFEISWQRQALPEATRCLVIDDLANRVHQADILLDQNFGRRPEEYTDKTPSACTLLIGPSYSLIRPEFAELRAQSLLQRDQRTVQTILVSLGGVDVEDVTSNVLKTLNDTPNADNLHVNVVMGRHAPAINRVRALIKEMQFSAKVLVDVQDMHLLMAQADLAIGAVGGTAWERACLGLPCLMITIASNQEPAAKSLDEAGIANWLGRHDDVGWERRLQEALARLDKPGALRQASERCAPICDGDGMGRVLAKMIPTQIHHRAARIQDARRIWEWRHENNAHRFNKDPRVIPYAEHYAWFEKVLSTLTTQLFILTRAGLEVGYIRLDHMHPSQAHVSLCLAGSERGHGLGHHALRIAAQIAAKQDVETLCAQVHPWNEASLKLFYKMGYIALEDEDSFRQFRLDVPGA